jgi:hypothetical protein
MPSIKSIQSSLRNRKKRAPWRATRLTKNKKTFARNPLSTLNSIFLLRAVDQKRATPPLLIEDVLWKPNSFALLLGCLAPWLLGVPAFPTQGFPTRTQMVLKRTDSVPIGTRFGTTGDTVGTRSGRGWDAVFRPLRLLQRPHPLLMPILTSPLCRARIVFPTEESPSFTLCPTVPPATPPSILLPKTRPTSMRPARPMAPEVPSFTNPRNPFSSPILSQDGRGEAAARQQCPTRDSTGVLLPSIDAAFSKRSASFPARRPVPQMADAQPQPRNLQLKPHAILPGALSPEP